MRQFASEPFDDWIAEAGVLGLWDVLKHYGYFRRKFHRMLEQIEETETERHRFGRLSGIQHAPGQGPATRGASRGRSSTILALKFGPGIAGAS